RPGPPPAPVHPDLRLPRQPDHHPALPAVLRRPARDAPLGRRRAGARRLPDRDERPGAGAAPAAARAQRAAPLVTPPRTAHAPTPPPDAGPGACGPRLGR